MPFRRSALPLVGVLVFKTIVGCAARPSPIAGAGKPIPLPMEDGVPVDQWYMNTQDADGSKLSHYIAEYGIESRPGNTVIVLHGGWGMEHSYLVPVAEGRRRSPERAAAHDRERRPQHLDGRARGVRPFAAVRAGGGDRGSMKERERQCSASQEADRRARRRP
ncbi:MAG: hypothetical protein EBR10_05375 [Planctomycetes bacterium]|nr:hypothetical protein [Planctomycetota bacterium]